MLYYDLTAPGDINIDMCAIELFGRRQKSLALE